MRRFQLGSRLPGIYLGIPTVNPEERKRLRQWFANMGWNTALSRPVCSVILRNLSTWVPPEGLTATLQSAEITYDLVYGWDFAPAILNHIKTYAQQGVADIYRMALGGAPNCGVIRAKRPSDGAMLGSVVIYNERSALAEHMPMLRAIQASVGGISSPVISSCGEDDSTVLQGLILLAIKQIRKLSANAVVMDSVRSSLLPFFFHLFLSNKT